MEPSAAPPLILDDLGQPRSSLYGDIYFSTVDGLAESRAVFLDGCDLPDAWAGRRQFVVGELGFGTGLNIIALLDLWRRAGPADGRLHIFSVEGHPIDRATAAAVLAAWPEVADLAKPLLAAWPSLARGFHRIDLPQYRVTLDLAYLEVAAALQAWTGAADAWFLDGFSPALNPQMWRTDVLDLVAARSRPDARLATFTVAGAVRRGLQGAGFTVEKRPGFGRKRQRLVGWRDGAAEEARPEAAPPPPRVAVIGAGIAGASIVRALEALGVTPSLYESRTPGAGASGNPAALVTPRLDAGLGPVAELFAQALRRASDFYRRVPGAVLEDGVLQLATRPRDGARFAKIAGSDLFPAGEMQVTDALGRDALQQGGAFVIRPRTVLQAWTPAAPHGRVDRLDAGRSGWTLWRGGQALEEVDHVVICAGAAAAALAALPLQPVRGQISIAPEAGGVQAMAWGGYMLAAPEGLVFGATHDRDDAGDDMRPDDHGRNLQTLAAVAPELAATLEPGQLGGRAAVRAVTPDRLPLAGQVAPGLHVLGGLGSRGFCLAPLLAEHVAAQILGAPTPLPASLSRLVDPSRFRAP
ncbi:tRNA (5-methylaminomethyl-2-thiouridine)(34)-methyltransferase MnmD [Phenylobacterium sp.]|uniref:tRNA (5-methylaminomethyl-2-thiouridine)(34)-methyltransferase MnmD n=1 Tax=Phenylobacterium sp. TaxID=1871053 RepID=UPI002FDAB7BE